jgi:plastocyanin
METDYSGAPGRGFYLAIGLVMLVVGTLVVAALAVPIQPQVPKQVPKTGIIMPSGAGSSQLNFSPAKVTLEIGVNNTVTWTNDDSIAHTVKSESIPASAQAFSSALLNATQTFSVTLTVAGTYTYECTLHPGFMQASIVVVGSTNSTSVSG